MWLHGLNLSFYSNMAYDGRFGVGPLYTSKSLECSHKLTNHSQVSCPSASDSAWDLVLPFSSIMLPISLSLPCFLWQRTLLFSSELFSIMLPKLNVSCASQPPSQLCCQNCFALPLNPGVPFSLNCAAEVWNNSFSQSCCWWRGQVDVRGKINACARGELWMWSPLNRAVEGEVNASARGELEAQGYN